jgi:hypothetical protein
VHKIALSKLKESSSGPTAAAAAHGGSQGRFDNKWPAGQQPAQFKDQALDYAAWLDDLQPLLETYFAPSRWWATIFSM